jgi:hypothetical protein
MSLWQLREGYKAWREWLREVRHREAAFENQQYPIVKVAVKDVGDRPFQLLIKLNPDAYTQDIWFATLEEAEARAAEFKRNLDAAKEANKRIQEMIHGQL